MNDALEASFFFFRHTLQYSFLSGSEFCRVSKFVESGTWHFVGKNVVNNTTIAISQLETLLNVSVYFLVMNEVPLFNYNQEDSDPNYDQAPIARQPPIQRIPTEAVEAVYNFNSRQK